MGHAELTAHITLLRLLFFGFPHLPEVPVFLGVNLSLFLHESNEPSFAVASVHKFNANPETRSVNKNTAIHHITDDSYALVFDRGDLNRHPNLDWGCRLYAASAQTDTGEVPPKKQIGVFRTQRDRDKAPEPRVTTVRSLPLRRRHG